MSLENKSKEETSQRSFKDKIELIRQFPIKQFYYVKPHSIYETETDNPTEYSSFSSFWN